MAQPAFNPGSLAAPSLDRPAGAFQGLRQAQVHPRGCCVACTLCVSPTWFSGTCPLGEHCEPLMEPPPTHVMTTAHDHALLSPTAPLVDLTPTHSGSAMLMLLSVVFVGLAVFVIYKFKRYVSLCPCFPALSLLRDRFRTCDVCVLRIAVMVSVDVLGRSRGLMFMPRCKMRKNERWSVESVPLKAGPISLRLN